MKSDISLSVPIEEKSSQKVIVGAYSQKQRDINMYQGFHVQKIKRSHAVKSGGKSLMSKILRSTRVLAMG